MPSSAPLWRPLTLKKASEDSSKIAKSAGIVGIAVMCSRLLGLIREQVFAAFFGAGYAYDAFVVAFRIPNLLRDLFGEGALSAAFVTVFSHYDEKYDASKTWKLASNVLVFLTIAISLLVLLGSFFSETIVNLLASGFTEIPGKTELTATLTQIMLPFLLFISLSAVVMGVLNTKGKFFVPAIASSFFNLGSIIGGVSLAYILPHYDKPAIMGMACGTLLGGFLQLIIQLPALRKTGFRFSPILDLRDPGLIRILKLMLPATIGLSAVQINIFVNTNFAASCAEGSVSWLNYAFRLVQLPIGIFGVALSIAVMPLFGRHAANKNISGLKETLASSLTMVFCLTIPATAGLILLSEPIIQLIFQRGAFTSLDTIATAETLSLYAIGLFAYSSNKLLVPAFYALNDTKYPVIASFLAVALNIIIIQFTITHFQHLAIALSTSITMLINFLFLCTILYFKLDGFSLGYLFKGLLKIITSTLILSILVIFGKTLFQTWIVGNNFQQLVSIFGIIAISVTAYGVLLYFMKLNELVDFIGKIKTKVFKS